MEGAALNEAHAREHRPDDALPHAAIVTSLVLLGPRIDELCGLTRGRPNLGAQVVRIGRSKTTGMREVDLVFTS